ncbi:MAG TPA: DUF222 domain-containing protein, partial [Brevibacterium sp.]|nr:DUF222 domain-containing protein [Brevibacterium sp.]
MTFTPDRKRRKSGKRDRRAAADSRGGASRRPPTNSNPMDSTAFPSPDARGSEDNTPVCPEGESSRPSSLAEQLKAAGLDLSGHRLAEVFNALDPVSTDDEETRTDTSVADAEEPCETVEAANSAEPGPNPEADSTALLDNNEQTSSTTRPATDDSASPTTASTPVEAHLEAGDDSRRPTSLHPVLTDSTWNDLAANAPEITDSIASLTELVGALRAFDRPMGPNDALQVIDGAEALRRLSESLSTLALAVYERVGTPKDSGAKSTKALIQERLNLSGREANRRAKLAENLGGRVALDGQPLEPEHPLVAEQLHLGTLPAEHLTV